MPHTYNPAFMRQAIALSREGSIVQKTGGAFGAVVTKDDTIIGQGYNQVIKQNDPTWHAEIEALRTACKAAGSPHLQGSVLYTSAQPCPMCLSAAYWAHIDHIYYAANVEDARKYGNFNDLDYFTQLALPNEQRIIKSTQVLQDEAITVWQEYAAMPDKVWY